MRTLFALTLAALLSCGGPRTDGPDRGSAAQILTYSDPCGGAGLDNWIFVAYESGVEEMLTKTKASSVGSDTGVKRIEVKAKTGTGSSETSGRTGTTGSESGSAGSKSDSKTSKQETESGSAGAKTDTKTGEQGTDSRSAGTKTDSKSGDQGSDSRTAGTKTDSKTGEQGSDSKTAKSDTETKTSDLDSKEGSAGSSTDKTTLEQTARGKLVIWARDLLAMLKRNNIDIAELRKRSDSVRDVERTFIAGQSAALVRVTKTLGPEGSFADLPTRANAHGGRVVAYTVRIRNNSKYPVSGVKLLDVLPDGMEFQREWLTDSGRSLVTGNDRAIFEVFKHEGRWAVVWGVTEPLKSGEEMTVTFGVVRK